MDVAVKRGVGGRVAVGVAVGTSGVNVAMGVAEISGVGVMPAIVVCVAPAIMVDMTAVPRKLRSSVGAGKLGTPHAWVRINKTLKDNKNGVDFRTFIVPPSDHPRRLTSPKTRKCPPIGGTFAAGDLFPSYGNYQFE